MSAQEAPAKYKCECCDYVGGDFLESANPFDVDDSITGCPQCKAINSLRRACQADGCTKEASSGNPDTFGYRYVWICWDHSPANPNRKAFQ